MRAVVNFKKNHCNDVSTLDKMIIVLEESEIHVLDVIITKYEIVRITEGYSIPPDCAVAVEATLIVSSASDNGDDNLVKYKLSNYFV